MTTPFLIGFFGWLLFIYGEVYRNYYIIEIRRKRPDYLSSFFVRAFFGLVALILMRPTLDPVFLWSWVQCWPAIVYLLTSFYLFFDPILNIKRGRAWDYQGQNSGMFFDKLPEALYYSLKFICLIGLVTSIIVLW